jgi:hypothetical protein
MGELFGNVRVAARIGALSRRGKSKILTATSIGSIPKGLTNARKAVT